MKIIDLYNGEKSLAQEMMKILPLFDKYFRPFQGQRAITQTGRSKKFEKVCDAFLQECATLTDAHIWIETSRYSITFNAKIHRPDSREHTSSVNYFSTYIFLGDLSGQNFVYKFNITDQIQRYTDIINTSLQDLETAQSDVEMLKDSIDKIKGSIPYVFKDIFK
jgi:hypothetical protein